MFDFLFFSATTMKTNTLFSIILTIAAAILVFGLVFSLGANQALDTKSTQQTILKG